MSFRQAFLLLHAELIHMFPIFSSVDYMLFIRIALLTEEKIFDSTS